MIAFKQLILSGDVGSDVVAVKHTLQRMAVDGSEAIAMNNRAGHAYVAALRHAQANAGVTVDGKYGHDTHAITAPHFTPVDEGLYQRSAIRRPRRPRWPETQRQTLGNCCSFRHRGSITQTTQVI